MSKKRFKITFPFGTLIFDVPFSNELDAKYFKWVLSPGIFQVWLAFAASPRPSNTYVILNKNATEFSISGSCVSYQKILDYFQKQTFQVSMSNAEGDCPRSTFDLSAKLNFRPGRAFISQLLGILLAVGQTALFEDLFNACFNEICASIKDSNRKYQAVAEIMLTATSPPFPMQYGRPQVIDTPSINRYLRVFDACFEHTLPKIGSKVVFSSDDRLNLRQRLIECWRVYRANLRPVRLDIEVDGLNKNLSNYSHLFWSYIYHNLDPLTNLIDVYPFIVDHLIPNGVIDAFVLWNELVRDPNPSYYQHHFPVLEDNLPERPFLKQLSPIGYSNIYRLAEPETTLSRKRQQNSSCMTTLVPFVRLYELLSPSDGTLLSIGATGILHKSLNNELVISAIQRDDLYQGLAQDDIERMLFKPTGSLGLMA